MVKQRATNFTRKYNINITLTAPYSNIRSIIRNVYVPFAYLLAMALPRQASANSADAPFIISAHSPGNFTIPMGLITNMTIKKGGSNNLWTTKEGISRQITIQLEIADLYDILPIPYDKIGSKVSESGEYGVYDENLRAFLGEGIMGADFSDIRISESRMGERAKKSIERFKNAGSSQTSTEEPQGEKTASSIPPTSEEEGFSSVEEDLVIQEESSTDTSVNLDDEGSGINEAESSGSTGSYGTE